MRHAVFEQSPDEWVCPFYDGTVSYNMRNDQIAAFGDGRNHGMVPIVRIASGTLISGAPQMDAPLPVGVPGNMVGGLSLTDDDATWIALDSFPYFGVAGYDLTALDNGWIILTYIVYGVGVDGEFIYTLVRSRDEGKTWDFDGAIEIIVLGGGL